ncbi:MAG: VCBS repeat-containing protein [Opitutaceae bacterium]|jgi:hypothetical protein
MPPRIKTSLILLLSTSVFSLNAQVAEPADTDSSPALPSLLVRLPYHQPAATADLGVGLWGWPFPVDRNQDGKPDLVVVSGASPYKGTYYFENTGTHDATGMEVFKPAVRIGNGRNDLTPSYLPDGTLRVVGPGFEYPDFLKTGADKRTKYTAAPKTIHTTSGRIRGQQLSLVDFDGDGLLDLIAGIGDWTDYGWDNAFDANGRWANGPLHGYVYLLKNSGTNASPVYGTPVRLQADNRDIDLYGMPSPVFADFRGTGKLDLICGEFVDGLTFFENIGTRTEPRYAPGRRLTSNGRPITMPLEMIVVTAFDWNADGRTDLVLSQEDGRVALIENTGRVLHSEVRSNPRDEPVVINLPEFTPPRFFRQQADEVKFGVLTSPTITDWDNDGRADIVTGNAAGEVAYIRNLGGSPVSWAEPRVLTSGADQQPVRFMAGYNGSIQGPAEAKWGYTNLSTGDWDGDGRADLIVSDITGRVYWLKNLGGNTAGQPPHLSPAQPIQVWWDGKPAQKTDWNWWSPRNDELVVQWRCTPSLVTLPGEKVPGLVTVDPEGYLALYRLETRNGQTRVLPSERIFHMRGASSFDSKHKPTGDRDGLLRLNSESAGQSGRRTYTFTDWDGDGRLDLLVNSVNVNFLKNVSTQPGEWLFEDQGPLDGLKLAGHSTTPAVGDLDCDGKPELLIGAEDGFFYHFNTIKP